MIQDKHKEGESQNKSLTVMEKKVIHRAATRGHANYGWLDTRHTFSFASYYDPERVHFGMLRVLNDDIVAPGAGFGTHPHDNMEIVSIPLEGTLEHRDSMGNVAVIREGDLQVMSAGTGIMHSEYNKNSDRLVKFLQIWVFPEKQDIKPRYDQVSYDREKMKNALLEVVSPCPTPHGSACINQQVWFFLGDLDKGKQVEHTLKAKDDGVYVFVIKGEVNVNGDNLRSRDGIGLWDTDKITITAGTAASVLVMEVPMR